MSKTVSTAAYVRSRSAVAISSTPAAPRLHGPLLIRIATLTTQTGTVRRTATHRVDDSSKKTEEETLPKSSDPIETKDQVLPGKKAFSLRPYLQLARIDKPAGSFLLFWPCAWSLTLAAQACNLPLSALLFQLGIFGTGAFVMRGAGCTINDMWDSKMDRLVERTKDRPLAAGDITYLQAWTFLGLQLSVGLGVLLQLNWYSIYLGASSLGLVVIYPLMKRITYWPQLVLGMAFNWGALLGWAAVNPPPVWQAVVPMYVGAVCWTLVYDTIYAHQDKRDDVHAGVKSTALLFGDTYTRPALSAFSVAFITLLSQGVAASNGTSLWALLTNSSLSSLLGSHHLAWLFVAPAILTRLLHQIRTVDLSSRADCWSKFAAHNGIGRTIWMGLFADYLDSQYGIFEAVLQAIGVS